MSSHGDIAFVILFVIIVILFILFLVLFLLVFLFVASCIIFVFFHTFFVILVPGGVFSLDLLFRLLGLLGVLVRIRFNHNPRVSCGPRIADWRFWSISIAGIESLA